MRDGSRERGRRYPLRMSTSPDSLTPRSARSASPATAGARQGCASAGLARVANARTFFASRRQHLRRATASRERRSCSGRCLLDRWDFPFWSCRWASNLRRCCESLRGPLMQHVRHRRHGHTVSPTQTSCLLCWPGRIVGPLGVSVVVFDVGPGLRITALHRDDDSTGAFAPNGTHNLLRPFCQCSSA